jgi:hypothetical protein
MKTNRLCMSALAVALFAIALPLTGAHDTSKADQKKSSQSDDTGLVQVAQTALKRDKHSKANATNSSEAARNQPAKNTAKARSKRLVPITAKMETQVGKFLREHHRELHRLLPHVKKDMPREYEKAMRDLNRNRLRLEQLEGRERYPAELELWKAQSRARLLGAKLKMGGAKGLRDALRDTLAEVYDLRTTLLQRDRDRTAERLKRQDEQLRNLQNDRDKILERQLLTLTRPTSKRNNRSIKTSARKTTPASSNKPTVKNTSAKNTPAKSTSVKKSSAKTVE